MITVEFTYKTKLGKWKYAYQYFHDINKAIKFIKYVIPKSSDKVYMGFTCDDSEELYEMNNRL